MYIPTPKHILEARKENNHTSQPRKKKQKLEYVPKSKTPIDHSQIPTYIPTPLVRTSSESSAGEHDSHIITDSIDEALQAAGLVENKQEQNGYNDEDIFMENDKLIKNGSGTTELSESLKTESKKKIDNTESKETLSLSSSSKQRRRHSSSSRSSSSRSHSSSHSSKHKEKHTNSLQNRSSTSSKSSSHHSHSSSSNNNNNSKSKHSDKSKEKETENSKHRSSHHSSSKERSRSSSSSSSRHKGGEHKKSSSSASLSKSHTKELNTTKSSKNDNEEQVESFVDEYSDTFQYNTDSDEDDVEAQCRMIFEEFDPQTVVAEDTEDVEDNAEKSDSNAKYDNFNAKKRVAYENADKKTPFTTCNKRPNHITNAMQVCLSYSSPLLLYLYIELYLHSVCGFISVHFPASRNRTKATGNKIK